MKRIHHFPITVMALAVLAVYGPTAAADDTTASDNDELNQYISFKNSIGLGIGNWSDKRWHEGIFDAMRDDGTYGSLNADITKRDDATGTWKKLTVRNLGMDDIEVGGSYEKQGDWGVDLNFSRIPRNNQYIVNTGLRGIGTQTQTITPTAAPGAGSDYKLEMRRDATSVTMFKNIREDLAFRIRFKNEEKSGDRQWGVRQFPTLGSSGGSYPAFVAEPIDSTTRQLDALLSYAGERLNLSGGYYGSWYDNHKSRLDVVGTAGGYTEMSLPPDNYAHQAYVQGNYRFTSMTRGLFKVSYTHAKQDASFMSTNNNGVSSWAPTATVGSSLQGEVNTTEAMLGVTAHPVQKLSMVAKLNYWDRQDNTPVRVDGTSGATNFHNNPFSNTRTAAMAEGTYRLPEGYSATAGLDYLHRKREYDSSIDTTAEFFSPYRTEVDETTYRFGVRRNLSATLNGSLRYSHAERDGSAYVPGEADWNYITPVHIADRKRNMWRLMLDWVPVQVLDMQFTYSKASDSYPAPATQPGGLRNKDVKMWSIDADYLITDDWKLVGWVSRDTDESLQASGDYAKAYQAYLNTKGTTAGLGLQGQVSDDLDTGINFDWTKTTGSYLQVSAASLPGGTVAPPDISNKLSRINLYGHYVIDTHSSVRLDLIREVWKTNDWTWAFSDGTSYSYATENTQIVNPWDQSATFVGGRYIYTF